jgi:hypothetical protein
LCIRDRRQAVDAEAEALPLTGLAARTPSVCWLG